MYVKVKTEADAWNLAYRLMPKVCELRDVERSVGAGYPIYNSSDPETKDYICDLNDRLELNYGDGRSENIWIEDRMPKGAEAIIGMYKERTIFGEVTVRDVKEIPYSVVQGLVVKELDDGRQGIELTLADGKTASFGVENIAYVRLG